MKGRVGLVDLPEAVASERRASRARILDFCRWSLARGRPIDPDLIALVLAARDEWGTDGDADAWTRLGVYQCLFADIFNWCSVRHVLVPDGVPEALWSYLHHLQDRRLFATGSDPLRKLIRPLRCYGGLGADGRPGSEGKPRRVRCVCKIPSQPKRRSHGA